jgi:SAM-dependent methyltransferase
MRRLKKVINSALESVTGYRLVAGSKRRGPTRINGGLVEEFGELRVRGWVATLPGSKPVRVVLQVNSLEIVATWATDGRPAHGGDELRPFDFVVRDLWGFCKQRDRLSISVGGRPLPIVGHGMYRAPSRSGAQNLAALRAKLQDGYVFAQNGYLQLSKRLDTAWQARVMALYDRVRLALSASHGYDVFLMYGTLLGAVREGTAIGHDLDFDAAYVSGLRGGAAAAAELREIALTLIDRGFDIQSKSTVLVIQDPADPETRIDLFHLYFDEAGDLQFPFGVAGTTEISASEWQGTREVEFCGAPALVPKNAEQMVELIYGPGWRSPKPGFDWRRDRTKRGEAGMLPLTYVQDVYWSNFYSRTTFQAGSPFFESVNARPTTPNAILDIGCGDGRDALAFASADRTVLGIDRSSVAVRRASERAAELGLEARVRFAVCDLADAEAFSRMVAELSDEASGPRLFYLRFLLHSIPAEVQETLLTTIGACATPGDQLAAEFRTDKDEQLNKAFGKHYRRYQDGPQFGVDLRERYGFEVLEEVEGQGLSPYQDEDPYLYRVIAVRR